MESSSKWSKRDTPKAFISFAICAFLMTVSLMNIPTLIITPQVFTLFFTLAMVSALFGLAFLNGPANYVAKMSQSKNIVASVALLISIILSLYFSVIKGSYIWSLVFCIIQVSNSYLNSLYFWCFHSIVDLFGCS